MGPISQITSSTSRLSNAAAAATANRRTPWPSRVRLICAASEPELRRDPSTRIRTKRDSCAAAKVGVVEFLNGVGKGVETHAAKVEEAVGGDLQSLLHARTLRLKKLGIPCKQMP
uniref:Expressed protein n=2 Tax=Oryza sativa subsp. japonica TaxID=39947 RepID=Q8SB84_ORYSJ|nr:Unknown protein [Oryza sativa]AAP52131.1 expressed protein [Oryza sativa Japonica Group]